MADRKSSADAVESQRESPIDGSSAELVTPLDMQQYQSHIGQYKTLNSATLDRMLDFDEVPIPGYDNCGPDHKLALEFNDNEKAGIDALNSPKREVPQNLSPQQKELAQSAVEGAKTFKETLDDKNLSQERFEKLDRGYNQLQESIQKLPDRDKDGAIAAMNKDLEAHGMRIERVPQTNDVYLGYKTDNGDYKLGPRLQKGECPSS
ncbi:MAG: hypothetical protein K2Y32_08450 [Candidatus Obscuribacterales bacterium]|nr:hypothetical protein [Candidatus Obscuribacterales bacterium]